MIKKKITFRCRSCNKEYDDWLTVSSCPCLSKVRWSSGRNKYLSVKKKWKEFVEG